MTDAITRLDTNAIMSQAAVHNGLVFLAGQVAADATASTAVQTEQVLAKIDALLARAGSDKTRLVSALIHLTDVGDFQTMNQVWSAWVPEGCAPVRTTVIAGLAMAGLTVEITVVAAVK